MISRRKFISHTVAGMAGATLAQNAFSINLLMQKKDKLGVALVGLGYYSTDLLAPALQLTQHCFLAGVVTGTPAKAEKWKQQYKIADKNIYNYENFDAIANNPDIDVVYVVLPPSMHAEYSIRAARAGKHVWCEKPMAVSVAECQSMIDACSKNKRKLSIGYRMHHEPNTQRIIQFRKDLTYGKVLNVNAAAGYFDPRTDHWKQKKSLGGGVMGDMGVYPLNAARYSTGLEPIAVTAQASTTRPEIYKEVEETMVFDLEFPGGVTAACEASFGKNMGTLQVNCTKGWYKLSPFQAYSGIDGITSDGIKLNATIPNQQAKQMDDDALSIINNTPAIAPGEEGLKDIRVVEAIYRSVAEKGKVKIG
ncbi:MAG: Gfo/Idh/MocA family oxidoreductase [Cyclobacteriaceae bacterium]|nr:Gfo/Idh/MocA family oxidoreductase [Cyclobacteriaceae bacterium]MDH4295933.1 Gfo/Idh/MocA family oxidoreductase [Cyclobacteriaceae bacterium]MDH5249441.1 Gfo/Idh/MocA family oxidoreductase [Cyclobacteriaceae bacterium]